MNIQSTSSIKQRQNETKLDAYRTYLKPLYGRRFHLKSAQKTRMDLGKNVNSKNMSQHPLYINSSFKHPNRKISKDKDEAMHRKPIPNGQQTL